MRCGYCSNFSGTATEIVLHQKAGCSTDRRWGQVIELRHEDAAIAHGGKSKRVKRKIRKILGVSDRHKMTEDRKEYLRKYNAENKDKVKTRVRIQRNIENALRVKTAR